MLTVVTLPCKETYRESNLFKSPQIFHFTPQNIFLNYLVKVGVNLYAKVCEGSHNGDICGYYGCYWLTGYQWIIIKNLTGLEKL